jgi:hypothetical protein
MLRGSSAFFRISHAPISWLSKGPHLEMMAYVIVRGSSPFFAFAHVQECLFEEKVA